MPGEDDKLGEDEVKLRDANLALARGLNDLYKQCKTLSDFQVSLNKVEDFNIVCKSNPKLQTSREAIMQLEDPISFTKHREIEKSIAAIGGLNPPGFFRSVANYLSDHIFGASNYDNISKHIDKVIRPTLHDLKQTGGRLNMETAPEVAATPEVDKIVEVKQEKAPNAQPMPEPQTPPTPAAALPEARPAAEAPTPPPTPPTPPAPPAPNVNNPAPEAPTPPPAPPAPAAPPAPEVAEGANKNGKPADLLAEIQKGKELKHVSKEDEARAGTGIAEKDPLKEKLDKIRAAVTKKGDDDDLPGVGGDFPEAAQEYHRPEITVKVVKADLQAGLGKAIDNSTPISRQEKLEQDRKNQDNTRTR